MKGVSKGVGSKSQSLKSELWRKPFEGGSGLGRNGTWKERSLER